MMALMELQEVLGNQVKVLMTAGDDGNTRRFQHEMERTEYLTKLAKQMNNTADNILRGGKMCNDTSSVKEIVMGK